jgi:acetylglutamate kinase
VSNLLVIKIGGNIVDDEQKLSSFLQSFASVDERKILVHGGGKIATRMGDSLGIQSKYVDGRRITDADTIDLVTMVYGGLINKKIVAQLQSYHCNAIGITGADANLIPASKRPVKEVDYGFVGDVKSDQLSPSYWSLLLNAGLIPVVAPLTHDGKGHILNTNADTIAQELAKALSGMYHVTLIYSFEKAGVLLDANDDSTVINTIDPAIFKQLKSEQKIFAGMIPKLDNAFTAIEAGVEKVIIGKAENLPALIKGEAGTQIVNQVEQ